MCSLDMRAPVFDSFEAMKAAMAGRQPDKRRLRREQEQVKMMTTNYVQIHRFCELTGYTEKAVRLKISEGVWLEGREYRKAPDKHVLISLEGYARWVEGENLKASSCDRAGDPSESISRGTESNALKPSTSRRRRPIRNTPPVL
ncbi:MAG: hypothetical protein ABW205_09050 [Burkholderiales bacterium]